MKEVGGTSLGGKHMHYLISISHISGMNQIMSNNWKPEMKHQCGLIADTHLDLIISLVFPAFDLHFSGVAYFLGRGFGLPS